MTNLEKKVSEAIYDAVVDGGYVLEGVEYKGEILKVVIDSAKGIDIADCVKVTNLIDPIIDLLEGMPEKFHLEVSSPGIDKQLKTLRDFRLRIGKKMVFTLERELETQEHEDNEKMAKRCKGQKHYVGKLAEIDDNNRLIVTIDKGNIYIPLEIIKKAQVEIEFGVPNKKVKE